MSRPMQALTAVALVWCGPASALPAVRAADAPLREVIDAEMRAAWQQHKIMPAKRGEDSEFLRRVCLDLTGVIPTYEETVAFLDSKEPAKRGKLLDRLLADPRFAQHQADDSAVGGIDDRQGDYADVGGLETASDAEERPEAIGEKDVELPDARPITSLGGGKPDSFPLVAAAREYTV